MPSVDWTSYIPTISILNEEKSRYRILIFKKKLKYAPHSVIHGTKLHVIDDLSCVLKSALWLNYLDVIKHFGDVLKTCNYW